SGLTRCVALEGAGKGVTCNTISPGTVVTALTRLGSQRRISQGGQGSSVEENLRRIAEAHPQKRHIEVGEVASLALFLASDAACGLTGEDLIVSGGAPW